jgi:hypothetical protein
VSGWRAAIAQKLLEQQAEINAARAAIARVRALHVPDPRGRSGFHPDDDDTPGAYGEIASACQECGSSDLAVRWPCPTIQAIDGQTRVKAEAEQPAPEPPPVREMTPEETASILPRIATEGVETPGCDCGHAGMGRNWHRGDCAWRSGGQR